nr:hypothetical protein [Neobacillus sp. Marseille-Q6967]
MKKLISILSIVFTLISLQLLPKVKADKQTNQPVIISEKEYDITGDNKNEKIRLIGKPYEEDRDYLKDIYIHIKSESGKTKTIPLESGTKASLKVVDLNRDGIKDLFANVLTGEKGSDTINYLFSLKDFVRVDLTVPDPLVIDSQFLNDFKAKLTIKENGQSFVFDLKDRKKFYKKLGLYYKGKINEPTELMVNSFNTLKPARLDDGDIGLKGVQKITGIASSDTIAYVESSWGYEDGVWKLIRSKVKTAGKES